MEIKLTSEEAILIEIALLEQIRNEKVLIKKNKLNNYAREELIQQCSEIIDKLEDSKIEIL